MQEMTLGAGLVASTVLAYSFVWLWVWAKKVLR